MPKRKQQPVLIGTVLPKNPVKRFKRVYGSMTKEQFEAWLTR